MERVKKYRRKSPLLVKTISLGGYFLMYFPVVIVIFDSFWSPTEGVSFFWFKKVFSNTEVLNAFLLSLTIAILSSLGAGILGTLSALALTRNLNSRGYLAKSVKSFLNLFTFLPLMVPEIVMGLSLLVWFSLLKMTLGLVSLVLAHITFSISYVTLTVRTSLEDLNPHYEEAAYDLGANRFQAFWKVIFPLIWPAILSGILMAFTLSFDDFVITFYTAGVGSDPLPLKIYSMVKFGISPEISALSTVMLFCTMGISVLAFRFKKNPQ